MFVSLLSPKLVSCYPDISKRKARVGSKRPRRGGNHVIARYIVGREHGRSGHPLSVGRSRIHAAGEGPAGPAGWRVERYRLSGHSIAVSVPHRRC